MRDGLEDMFESFFARTEGVEIPQVFGTYEETTRPYGKGGGHLDVLEGPRSAAMVPKEFPGADGKTEVREVIDRIRRDFAAAPPAELRHMEERMTIRQENDRKDRIFERVMELLANQEVTMKEVSATLDSHQVTNPKLDIIQGWTSADWPAAQHRAVKKGSADATAQQIRSKDYPRAYDERQLPEAEIVRHGARTPQQEYYYGLAGTQSE